MKLENLTFGNRATKNRVDLSITIDYPWTWKELKALANNSLSALSIILFNYLLEWFAYDECGKTGYAYEVTIRSILANRLVKTVKVNGFYDLTSRLFKKFYNLDYLPTVEVKHACCAIPKNVVDFVVYVPMVNEYENIINQAYVFNWNEWLEMLGGYNGRGQLLKDNSSRNQINIQSFYGSETVRPKASKPIANYLWNCCKEKSTVSVMSETFANMSTES